MLESTPWVLGSISWVLDCVPRGLGSVPWVPDSVPCLLGNVLLVLRSVPWVLGSVPLNKKLNIGKHIYLIVVPDIVDLQGWGRCSLLIFNFS